MEANTLATRALNEYRRRDIATYLSARYYLSASCAQSNNWARKVALDSILLRSQGSYLRVLHFKELLDDGRVEHRALHMPTGSEAVGEAALLEELASRIIEDASTSCVYSYKLMQGSSKAGLFEEYMKGLQARQQAIAESCSIGSNLVVLYVDIKRFYPSIRHDLARAAWEGLADTLRVPERIRHVGEKLLDDYGKLKADQQTGLPIGPAFSHIVANAVLRSIDLAFSKSPTVRYFRYVDDIVFVGTKEDVWAAQRALREHLQALSLEVHGPESPKTIEVPAVQWLAAAADFHLPKQSESWPGLVFGLKRLMLIRPDARESLAESFRSEGFRLPLQDYSRVVRGRSFVSNALLWARRQWWRRTATLATAEGALQLAALLRERYRRQFQPMVEGIRRAEGFERKRLIPRLRYLSGRLVYLARPEDLRACADLLDGVPELYLHGEVMRAVATGDATRVVELGGNAVQAVAQPLHAAGRVDVECRQTDGWEQAQGALAVLYFNGLRPVVQGNPREPRSDLLEFSMTGTGRRLMRAEDRFVQETACLRGLDVQIPHHEVIGTAFDQDETYALDAIDQLQNSASL